MTTVTPASTATTEVIKDYRPAGGWFLFGTVFLAVLGTQLVLVAVAGTDVPFHDQWNIEGQWLYPKWREGSLTVWELFQAFNEHRVLWTHLLNLALFSANGQWDPLLQMTATAVLRAGCAAGVALYLARPLGSPQRIAVGTIVIIAFLPHLAWHAVLWGIESHAYFSLGFSLLALGILGRAEPSFPSSIIGSAVCIAGFFAMAPSALVPIALLGIAGVRMIEHRQVNRPLVIQIGGALVLLLVAVMLRVEVQDHHGLNAQSLGQFFGAAARVLAWPHANSAYAAFAMNIPIVVVLAQRLLRRRLPRRNEDFVLLVGGWSVACALATAWVRGGSEELVASVPSRYVDFIVLLPLANIWCAAVLTGEFTARHKSIARVLATAWGVFLLVGWIGLSMEVMRWLVIPRARDREAPVRLVRAFQETGDATVFRGQPLLLVPHPDPETIRAVLVDPRLKGALPPSLQPNQDLGPLSRATRLLLGHP